MTFVGEIRSTFGVKALCSAGSHRLSVRIESAEHPILGISVKKKYNFDGGSVRFIQPGPPWWVTVFHSGS
jgi:hypothetical protein